MAKRKRTNVRLWAPEDVRILRTMAKAKMAAPQIAKKLRRTRGAVAQKAMALGVRFRSINRRRITRVRAS